MMRHRSLPKSSVLLTMLFLAGTLLAQQETVPVGEERTPSKIEPGDVLEIVILGEEELSRSLMVMHSGNISFPLIGDVRVAGLTTAEVTELLGKRLKSYFMHPVISVILKSPSVPHVSVFGGVVKPGAVEYQRGLRVTDYLALSGGPLKRADLSQVKVVRFVEGRSRVDVIDVSAIISHGESAENFIIKSGDWLYVPTRITFNWSIILQTATLIITLANAIVVFGNNR